MNRTAIATVAFVVTMGLAGTASAQGRHDEKPHGVRKPAATQESSAAPGMPGRHDERPHGPRKPAAKKAEPEAGKNPDAGGR